MILDRKQISSFWEQLQDTIEQLLSSRSDDRFEAEPLLKKYREELQKIDRNLTFHFQSDDEKQDSIEMVFGCDGFPESIHSVLSLIGAAPELSGIEFKAFNNRYDPVPLSVNIGEEFSEIHDFWVRLVVVEKKLHLEVYLEDAPKVLDMDPRVEAVMIYLDALIGEYEIMTRIWALEWFDLPVSPEDYGLIRLVDLREYFDKIKEDVKPIGLTLH
ncbi:hypothetical protein [Neptuniibacter caesariensis]|uniref:Uncharacterized protein n=1 Tax=Neptuniibacter caesariensis TaxID=207954 RepID=A0A7U8C659_NEPCE|nr:hypothetical protein [Neptuniibacter caesariensis]EAR62237.1 hypothetical protein MED92_14408 [Oceanospirillum sp. MED92] [Neptuniibacter caesariensis]